MAVGEDGSAPQQPLSQSKRSFSSPRLAREKPLRAPSPIKTRAVEDNAGDKGDKGTVEGETDESESPSPSPKEAAQKQWRRAFVMMNATRRFTMAGRGRRRPPRPPSDPSLAARAKAAEAAAQDRDEVQEDTDAEEVVSPKEAAHKHWRKAALLLHVSHQFAQAGKAHQEARQKKKGGAGRGRGDDDEEGEGPSGVKSGSGGGGVLDGGGIGGASLLRRVPNRESLRGPNAMAKFRRSVSAVKASNRFARMVSDKERSGGGGMKSGGRGGGGGGGGSGGAERGAPGGIGRSSGGGGGDGWSSLKKLRRQMEQAMEQAYEQALAFQRACVFALVAALGPVVLCWLVNVTRLWTCLLDLHTSAERIHAVTSIHVPAPDQEPTARDYGRTDADLMTWQREMKRLQADIFDGVTAGNIANINAANFEVSSASGGGGGGTGGGGGDYYGELKRMFVENLGGSLFGTTMMKNMSPPPSSSSSSDAAAAAEMMMTERSVHLGLLLVGHVALTVSAYLTRRPEAAISAGLMNFPLLRTVFLIKRLDDAMAQASGMVREAQMRLVELPLDVAEMQPPPVAALPTFWFEENNGEGEGDNINNVGGNDDHDAFHSSRHRGGRSERWEEGDWEMGATERRDPYAIPGAEAARVAAAAAAMSGAHHQHQRRVLLHSALMHKADRLAHYWESQDLGIAVNVLGLGQVSLNITLVLSIIIATIPMLWETARKFTFGPGAVVYARLTHAWMASRKDAVKAAARQAVSTVNTVIKKSSFTDVMPPRQQSAETSSPLPPSRG